MTAVYTGGSSTGRTFDATEMDFSPGRLTFEWAEMGFSPGRLTFELAEHFVDSVQWHQDFKSESTTTPYKTSSCRCHFLYT